MAKSEDTSPRWRDMMNERHEKRQLIVTAHLGEATYRFASVYSTRMERQHQVRMHAAVIATRYSADTGIVVQPLVFSQLDAYVVTQTGICRKLVVRDFPINHPAASPSDLPPAEDLPATQS